MLYQNWSSAAGAFTWDLWLSPVCSPNCGQINCSETLFSSCHSPALKHFRDFPLLLGGGKKYLVRSSKLWICYFSSSFLGQQLHWISWWAKFLSPQDLSCSSASSPHPRPTPLPSLLNPCHSLPTQLALFAFFIWLQRVSVVAHGISIVSCGIFCTKACGILVPPTRDQTWASCIARQILNHWTIREVPWLVIDYLFPAIQW